MATMVETPVAARARTCEVTGLRVDWHAETLIKVNAVVVRGFNDEDVVPLAALTVERPWEVRFIEMMPFGSVGDFADAGVVKSEETMDRIAEEVARIVADRL